MQGLCRWGGGVSRGEGGVIAGFYIAAIAKEGAGGSPALKPKPKALKTLFPLVTMLWLFLILGVCCPRAPL